MRIHKFRVQNYKGIKDATLVLGEKPGTVHTLIGLNESGKTTLLEAINLFRPNLDGIQKLAQNPLIQKPNSSFVPRARDIDFSGYVAITATIQLNEADVDKIGETIENEFESVKLSREKLLNEFTVEKKFSFENSIFQEEETLWSTLIVDTFNSDQTELGAENEVWQAVIKSIQRMLPNIVYFPNFLFDVPDKIIIHGQNQTETDQYFTQVIDNILQRIKPNLNLQEHLIEETMNIEKGQDFGTFERSYSSSTIEQRNEATMSYISNAASQVVFKQWAAIQPNAPTNTQFQIKLSVDPIIRRGNAKELATSPSGQIHAKIIDHATTDRVMSCKFVLIDNGLTFALRDRSIGFRWFFAFFMFTFFNRPKDDQQSTIYLLDEPASNLHANAQKRILESFSAIANSQNDVIYSTHSHYLINPQWLENAHIIKNQASASEEELGEFTFSKVQSDIEIHRYKTFVGNHPNDSLYFLPVLDALDYEASNLDFIKNAILVEGKSDYYALCWYRKFHRPDFSIDIIPVSGAGNAGPIAALLTGWGKEFIFLHDNDRGGINGAKKLTKDIPTSNDCVIDYSTAVGDPNICTLEDLLSDTAKEQIANRYQVQDFQKSHVINAFSECLNGIDNLELDDVTLKRFDAIFHALERRMETF